MADRSRMSRRGAIIGLAGGIVGATLLATGAAGSLAADLRPGGADSRGSAMAVGQTQSRPANRPADFLAQVRPGARLGWHATSPATHQGDRYRLVLTNGATAQTVGARAMIMDHRNQTNMVGLQELVTLAPGEQRELTASNDYGTANHFSTGIASENRDLAFEVTLTDASGVETARFNQRAFMQRQGGAGPRSQEGTHHGPGMQGQ